MITQENDIIFSHGTGKHLVSIIVPLFNYADVIGETLNSVASQTTKDIALIVIDDCSTDHSVNTVKQWMQHRVDIGMSMLLVRNRSNAKLSITRNSGIQLSKSNYCFMLDADNILYPSCIEKLSNALSARPDADAAYSLLEVFEGDRDIIGAGVFIREALSHGNFIDAMAMFRRSVLLELEGYEHMPSGWEDYDLWLRLVEMDRIALHVPEILARYRQHDNSMLRTETNVGKNITNLHNFMKNRHPWLDLH